jgi:hypothetical protein
LYTSSGATLCSSVSFRKDMLVERVGSVSCGYRGVQGGEDGDTRRAESEWEGSMCVVVYG